MSKLGLALIIACGLLLGAVSVWTFESKPNTAGRPYIAGKIGPVDLWGHSPRGKGQRSYNVDLSTPNGITDETVIVGEVKVLKSKGQVLHYSWVLPEGVSLSQGPEEGIVANSSNGDSSTIEISVRNFNTSQASFVTLQVWEEVGSVKFGGAGTISNENFEKLDSIRGVSIQSVKPALTKKPRLFE